MMQLRNYQIDAVDRLKRESLHLLNSHENEILVLQAPTGSGKTLIVAEYLRQLAIDNELKNKYAFIWISVRRLHDQSKDKLEKYYEIDRAIKCSYFEELEDKKIREDEILFLNWQSINKKDINIFIKDNEYDNNLNSIIQNTKEDGRQIILIIDESHHTASSEKSRELIEIISPKLTIEVSATPQLREEASTSIKINLSDVKEEEMIKNDILVNPEFMNVKIGSKSADEIVIEQALKKRMQLKDLYAKENTDINPLILIQLPSKKNDMDDKKDEILRILNDKYKLSEENGKVAVWLSEDKSETLPNIEKNDNDVEVLIFKEAIALGWDCPRASILVIFRETKSFTFTIQTVGRIMRMPELKHYSSSEELNAGYIFTNLETIEITEDYVKDYISVYESKRKESYKNIELKSIFLKRKRERTRLSGDFVKIFSQEANKFGLKEKLNMNPSKIANKILADGKIMNIDKLGMVEQSGSISIGLSEIEIQVLFDNFIKTNCTPFAPSDSSDRMKTALYQFFSKEFGFDKYDPKVQLIVLGNENAQMFVDVINLAKERYKTEVVQQITESREKIIVEKWEVPRFISFTSRFEQRNTRKSIMEPFYIRKLSAPEEKFIEKLNSSNEVEWWFKNGESGIKYFAVLYEDKEKYLRAFYVDFVVQFKDGRVGLFDPKEGRTAEESDAKLKAEALHRYIKDENKKGKNLFGGLVIYENGTWRYNDEEDYHYSSNELSNWKVLEIK